MEAKKLLEVLHLAERLKDATRHCYTSGGRRESVAEHTWRMCLMALLMEDEFPDVDMNKVIKMCIIHDLGEAFTGDIPVFYKTAADEEKEASLLNQWVASLPAPYDRQLQQLFAEMDARETVEAKIYKALDGMEAVIQHNESALDTWIPHEYELNKTYAEDRVTFSPYLTEFRKLLREETEEKLEREGKQ